MPVVLELVKLGFTREEIAKAMQASVSTIQRDLYELRMRRLIPEAPIKWDRETQKRLIRSAITQSAQHNNPLSKILRAWLQQQETDMQGQSPLPLPKKR
jgi:hypothetical protein